MLDRQGCWRVLAAGTITLLTARMSSAADPPATEPIDVDVWAGPNTPESIESGRAVGRVTEDQIRDSAPGSLADAVRGRAGVAVQQTTPGQGTVYVRGLSSR